MYYILSGRHPFELDNVAQPQYEVLRQLDGEVIFDFVPFHQERSNPFLDQISEEAMDLIVHMVCADPDERYDAVQARRHPWFVNYVDEIEEESNQNDINEDLLQDDDIIA